MYEFELNLWKAANQSVQLADYNPLSCQARAHLHRFSWKLSASVN